MKTVIIVLLTLVTFGVNATENEYSAKIRRFCELRKGINVRGTECSDLVEAYLKKFNLVPVRRTVIDTTNSTQHLIQAGDYVYFHKWKGEHGKITSHFAVIIEVKDGKFRFADQNVRGSKGVQIGKKFGDLKTLSGQVEVYGYKKGKFNDGSSGSLRPK